MDEQEKQPVSEQTAQEQAKAPEPDLIDIGYLSKVQLRVATIVTAQQVPDTDKLMQLTIKVGDEERTLVAGIALSYEPDDLPGKQIVVVANLKPAKLRGIMSQGMLLAASDENGLALLTVDKPVAAGSPIR